ncbi:MAG: SAM-dependent methyltransferase [Clostridia bacterium]|nr:SAM-dependent methyltransferase [Clostridia bacterium]
MPACNTLADIGTDHGFLPLYLLKTQKIARAVCADINPSPLESARRNFLGSGLESCADFRLGNGMEVISQNEVDIAVIAGMGGDTIAEIIEADTSKTPRFVLQPMTKTERLRSWLNNNGWGTEKWNLVYDSGRLYEVMLISRSAPRASFPFIRFGTPDGVSPVLYGQYVDRCLSQCKKALIGVKNASEPDLRRLNELEEDLCVLTEIQNNFLQR